MKAKKIAAGIMASAVAATAMAAAAGAYEGFLMYAAGDWSVSAMGTDSYPEGNIDVTTDGTYTVKTGGFTWEDEETGDLVPAEATGATVFCVDITDVAKDYGFASAGIDDLKTGADKMAYAKAAGINVTDIKVTTTNADGSTTDYPVDSSKILFGDIEGNGKLRIEVYNEYGDTKNDAPLDNNAIAFDETIAVTFTITGLDGSADAAVDAAPAEDAAAATQEVTVTAADTTAAVTSSKGSPDTGIADVAAVAGLAVVAAGAVVIAKKRK